MSYVFVRVFMASHGSTLTLPLKATAGATPSFGFSLRLLCFQGVGAYSGGSSVVGGPLKSTAGATPRFGFNLPSIVFPRRGCLRWWL